MSPLDEPSTEPIVVFLVDDLLCLVVMLQRHSQVQVIAHRLEIIFKALASKYIVHVVVFEPEIDRIFEAFIGRTNHKGHEPDPGPEQFVRKGGDIASSELEERRVMAEFRGDLLLPVMESRDVSGPRVSN